MRRNVKLIMESGGCLAKDKKEVNTMDWQFIVALMIVIPVILFPAAFVWYLNASGIYKAIKEARTRKLAKTKEVC